MGRCNKQYEDVNSGQEEFEARKNLSKTRGPSTSFKRCESRMDVKTMYSYKNSGNTRRYLDVI